MGENSVIIQLENIVFSYAGGKPVLDDLCFTLEEGAKLGLIGQNGSGKTTMLHIIMGLLTTSSFARLSWRILPSVCSIWEKARQRPAKWPWKPWKG